MAGAAIVNYAYALLHWRTVDEFRAHLAKYPPSVAPWARGVVLHHTLRPTPSQWNGARTMDAMSSRYEAKGWRGGPHLFIAVGSPKSENDGIWQMCPLNLPGVHCSDIKGNNTMWGIEVVGDYDVHPWPDDLHTVVRATTLELMKWRGITVSKETLKGHREYPAAHKTCPGTAINMDTVRTEFRAYQG
jgi:hypothetical protein